MKSAGVLSAGIVVVASAAFTFEGQRAVSQVPWMATFPNSDVAVAAAGPVAPVAPAPTVWRRPEGPVRVALQAGHWKSNEAPDEQAGLRGNGTRGGGKAEWEVNLEIARLTASLLEAQGYVVEILPTTIPPGYWADLFVSIHADGNASSSVSGFRAAAPRRDETGKSAGFADMLEKFYGEATGLRHYPTVTRRMENYYAFNWRRYEHSLHPMTVAVILETGFLTSPVDRRIIVSEQHRSARGIADAIHLYLKTAPPLAEVVLPSDYGAPRLQGRRSIVPAPVRATAETGAAPSTPTAEGR